MGARAGQQRGGLPPSTEPKADSAAAVYWRNRTLNLFDRLPLPAAFCAGDGAIKRANSALAAEWGMLAGQLHGRDVLDLLHPVTRADLHTIADAVRLNRRSRYDIAVHWTTSGGRRRHGEMTVDLVSVDPATAPDLLLVVHSIADPPATERNGADHALRADPLELRILALAAGGATTPRIATTVGLTRDGVNYHLKQLSQRWGVTGKAALVARAYAGGLLAPHTWPPRPARPQQTGTRLA